MREVSTGAPTLLDGDFDDMVGRSARMRALFAQIERVAPLDLAVLIQGETGTGKELVARSIHRRSMRRDGAFLPVACPAIQPELFESELFGHERGAFTGAVDAKPGLVEAARQGTLFLDEVGDLAPSGQAKLLRVLQEGDFLRVGGTRTRKSDTRIIAATNVDLPEAVGAGQFREDLYWRLASVTIDVPPLRDRGAEDITALALWLLPQLAREVGRPCPQISAGALAKLAAHDWPGNVREMQVRLRHAVLRCGHRLEVDDLPFDGIPFSAAGLADHAAAVDRAGTNSAIVAAKRTAADFRRRQAEAAIREASGNLTNAARRLGISYRQLYRWRHGRR